MNFLLDTHVLLWWLDDAPDLSDEARELIKNKEDLVFVSAATIWEIRIKQGLGKLAVPDSFMSVLMKQAFEFLPITIHHADAIKDLPTLHRDSFDRILIAQAICEDLTIITQDSIFPQYPVAVIRA